MANNLEERLNALKGKQDNVGDQFSSDDIRTLVEGIEYAMSHGGTVGVTITALEDGSGYKITIIDSEGGAHEATLKNGGDAYEVYKSTVPSGQTPMSKDAWLASLKGADGADGATPTINQTTKHWEINGSDTGVVAEGQDGADAVNPFKGYYPSGVNKPATGAVGDYLYAPPSDQQSTATATIWHYDSTQTHPWTDTGIDVSAVVALEFGSGQSVPATKIKDEAGKEVSGVADVLSAEAGKVLSGENLCASKLNNGSQGNPSNAYVVTIGGIETKAIPVEAGRKYQIRITRPNTTGMKYYYGVYTYSTNDPSTFFDTTTRIRVCGRGYIDIDEPFEIYTGENGVSLLLVEAIESGIALDSTEYEAGHITALRTNSFDGYEVKVLDVTDSKRMDIDSNKESINDVKSAIKSITGTEINYLDGYGINSSGTIVSSGSTTNFIVTDFIPVNDKSVVVWHYYGGAGLSTSYCRLVLFASDKETVLSVVNSTSDRGYISILTEQHNGAAYLRAVLSKDYQNARIEINGEAVYTPIRNSSSIFLQAKKQEFTIPQQRQIRENIGINGDNIGYSMRNGSQGNPSNAYVITIYGKETLAIPVEAGRKYKVVLNKQPESGYSWFYSLLTYSTDSPSTLTSNIVRSEGNSPSAHSLDELISINTGEYGLSIQLSQATHKGATPQSEYNHAIRVTDFTDNDIVVLDVTDSATEQIKEVETRVSSLEHKDVVARNEDKLPMLVNSCRLYGSSNTSKNFQVAICTDMHSARLANQNVIKAVNDFIIDGNVPLIDAYVNCGDIMSSYYVQSDVDNFQSDFEKLTRTGFVVCGNHDVGNAYYVGYCCNHLQAYNAFIKPMVDKGFLVSGEYETGKPYWYHDINNTTRGFKVRIIGLYEYDDALAFNETYWKAIPYDSNLSAIQLNTSYSVGNKVNATNNYTEYSFECVQAVTTPSSFYPSNNDLGKIPSYIVHRGYRVIRQDQAQWFLDTLASTPSNSGIVVVMHSTFGNNAVSIDAKFSYPSGAIGSNMSPNYMTTDFIRDAVVAYINGTNYSENVVMNGAASYLNDHETGYAYHVEKDFSTYKNDNVVFWGFLGGHTHKDLIWKDNVEDVYQISPTCSIPTGPNAYKFSDIRRSKNDGLAYDSITVVSFADGRIGLVKIGANVTDRGTKRDYMVLDTNN